MSTPLNGGHFPLNCSLCTWLDDQFTPLPSIDTQVNQLAVEEMKREEVKYAIAQTKNNSLPVFDETYPFTDRDCKKIGQEMKGACEGIKNVWFCMQNLKGKLRGKEYKETNFVIDKLDESLREIWKRICSTKDISAKIDKKNRQIKRKNKELTSERDRLVAENYKLLKGEIVTPDTVTLSKSPRPLKRRKLNQHSVRG